MDERNLRIIELLIRNARISKSEIARELGITETAVRKRIRKLEDERVILGYRAIVNYRKIGMVYSFTGIDVEPEALIDVMRSLKAMREVCALYLTSGDHDLLVEIVCRNMNELEKLHKKIASLRGVRKICPAIITEIIEIRKSCP